MSVVFDSTHFLIFKFLQIFYCSCTWAVQLIRGLFHLDISIC
jgi:hypothetical protein